MNNILEVYKVTPRPMILSGGTKQREWMDNTPSKYAYRCLPLSIANQFGWDIIPRNDFLITWNGGDNKKDLSIHHDTDTDEKTAIQIDSQFGCGILTFLPGYLFKTTFPYGLLVTGPINDDYYNWATPLSGIVETHWLNFTFTLNWKLRNPGTFTIKAGKPVGRIIPINLNDTWEIEEGKNERVLDEFSSLAVERDKTRYDLDQAYEKKTDFGSVKYKVPATEWDKKYYRGIDVNGKKEYNHILKISFPDFEENNAPWKV